MTTFAPLGSAAPANPGSKPHLGFPAEPIFRSEPKWSSQPAFPNVLFKNPVVIEPEPGTDRLFVGELEGAIAAVSSRDRNTSEKKIVLDITKQTQGGFDSGLLGIAFHPEYGRTGSPNRDYVYVFYSWSDNPVLVGRPEHTTITWTRISRFTMNRQTGLLEKSSEQVLIHQKKRIIFHVGGGMFFHPKDGFLYIAMGDEGAQQDGFQNSQRVDLNLFAGVLRIDVDRRGGAISHPIRKQPRDGTTAHYYIPSDNPFVGRPDALEEFYAIGLRSPHRMTHDPVDNLAWIGEIGQATKEEVEVLQIGKAPQNFQWAVKEGNGPGFRPMPEKVMGIWTEAAWEYGRDMGRSVIGGYVYRGQKHRGLRGKYICSDFANGRVWALTYQKTEGRVNVTDVELLSVGAGFRNYHGGIGGITSFGLDHTGELLVLRHGPATRIEELVETGSVEGNVPEKLSATGVFADLATLRPAPGFVAYDVAVPQWANGAASRRWISVPTGEKIEFERETPWHFPPGTVIVQQLDWAKDAAQPDRTKRLETRVLIAKRDGSFYGLGYRWLPDQSDAVLVTEDDDRVSLEGVDESREKVRVLWPFPSSTNCTQCHSQGAGYVLGVKTRQLDRDGQLERWNKLGLFKKPLTAAVLSGVTKLTRLQDTGASVEQRVRSYLDANCSHCHNSAPIPAAWRGNSTLPLDHQGLVFGPLVGVKPGGDHYVISPQDPAGSDLFERVSENIIGKRMPPLESDRVDRTFTKLLRQWIDALPRTEATAPAPMSGLIKDATTIEVVFSEAVSSGKEAGGAENPKNYQLSGGAKVESAELQPDRRTVVLTTSPLAGKDQYTLQVTGVTDRATKPNTLATDGPIMLERAIERRSTEPERRRPNAN